VAVPVAFLFRLARLAIEDLLEHLAHARPHQDVLLGVGVVISTADPRQLTGIKLGVVLVIPRIGDIIVVAHGGIVARGNGNVNGRAGFPWMVGS
jgi:hypothetical protein